METEEILEVIQNTEDPEELAQIMESASKKLGILNVVPTYTCPHCGHEWVPRGLLSPKRCPKCQKMLNYGNDL